MWAKANLHYNYDHKFIYDKLIHGTHSISYLSTLHTHCTASYWHGSCRTQLASPAHRHPTSITYTHTHPTSITYTHTHTHTRAVVRTHTPRNLNARIHRAKKNNLSKKPLCTNPTFTFTKWCLWSSVPCTLGTWELHAHRYKSQDSTHPRNSWYKYYLSCKLQHSVCGLCKFPSLCSNFNCRSTPCQ